MAEFTRVNGGAAPYTAIGRKLEWVEVVGDLTGWNDGTTIYADGTQGALIPESDFEKVRRALDKYCSITVVGEPDATATMFGVEGLGVNGTTPAEWKAQLDADLVAAGVTATVEFRTLVGNAFV